MALDLLSYSVFYQEKEAVNMANRLLKLAASGIIALEVLLLPVYAQNDATDSDFSFDRLAEMEKRLEEAPQAEKSESVASFCA